jgi:hypothetical protein
MKFTLLKLVDDMKPKGNRRNRLVQAIRYIHSLIEVLEGNEGIIMIQHEQIEYESRLCILSTKPTSQNMTKLLCKN